jgi:hypothetical protein
MNRLAFSEDEIRLSFSLEVSGGGKPCGTRMISGHAVQNKTSSNRQFSGCLLLRLEDNY